MCVCVCGVCVCVCVCIHIRKYCHLYLRIHPTTEQRILPFMGRLTYADELQMVDHELECSL